MSQDAISFCVVCAVMIGLMIAFERKVDEVITTVLDNMLGVLFILVVIIVGIVELIFHPVDSARNIKEIINEWRKL